MGRCSALLRTCRACMEDECIPARTHSRCTAAGSRIPDPSTLARIPTRTEPCRCRRKRNPPARSAATEPRPAERTGSSSPRMRRRQRRRGPATVKKSEPIASHASISTTLDCQRGTLPWKAAIARHCTHTHTHIKWTLVSFSRADCRFSHMKQRVRAIKGRAVHREPSDRHAIAVPRQGETAT